MHDPDVYPNPDSFNPDRFLPKEQGGLAEPDPSPTVFGFGRRICPGMHLAESGLWMYAATVLAVFDIQPVKDADGMPIPPKAESGPGIIR